MSLRRSINNITGATKLGTVPQRLIGVAGNDDFAHLAQNFRALAQDTRDSGLRAEFLKLAEECEKLQDLDEHSLLMAQQAIRE